MALFSFLDEDKRDRVFRFLESTGRNVGDFGQAVVDRVGGGILRSGVRLGGLISEPLPGEQRKATERFIERYLEPNKGLRAESGIGSYDESSLGGRTGRIVGTGIKGGVDIAGIGKAGKLAERGVGALSKGKSGDKLFRFLGRSAGASTASLGMQAGRGDELDPTQEFGLGLAFDAAGAGAGSLLRQGAKKAPYVFSKLKNSNVDKLSRAKTPDEVRKVLGGDLPEEAAQVLSRVSKPENIQQILDKISDQAQIGVRSSADAAPAQAPRTAMGLAEEAAPSAGERQRGLLRTTQQEGLAPAVRQGSQAVEPQTYQQMDIEGTLTQARERVAKQFDESKRIVDEGLSSGRWNDETAALTRAMIEKAGSEGNHQLVTDLMEKAARLGTESGQANVLWRGLANAYDPEGMVKLAEKIVKDANDRAGILTKIFRKGEYKLSGEAKDKIRKQMQDVIKMADGPEKDRAMSKVFDTINDQVPVGASDIFDALRINGMLSNPRTQLRNIFGTAWQAAVVRPATIGTRGFVDWVGATITGRERKHFVSDLADWYKGVGRALRNPANEGHHVTNTVFNAWESAKAGWRGDVPIDKPDLKTFRSLQQKNMPKWITGVTRMMEAQDRFFQSIVASGEYAIQKSRGVADDVAKKSAESIAKESVFRAALDPKNATGQGQLLSALDKVTQSVMNLRGRHPALSWFVPFVQTPVNITKQMIEYSPLGFATMKGSTRKTEQAAKAMIGSAIFLGAAKKAWDNEIVLSPPKSESERELFYAQGKRPNSIKIGDNWIPLIYFGPWAYALVLPAALKEAHEESPMDAGMTEVATSSVMKQFEFFTSQTYLEGFSNFMDVISGKEDATTMGALGFTASQAIPFSGLNRWVNSIIDPIYRQKTGFVDSVKENLGPGTGALLGRTNEPYPDVLTGEDARRPALDPVTPWTIGQETGTPEQRVGREANADFLKTLRRASKPRRDANEKINEALEQRDYEKANQIAEKYNQKLRETFQPWLKEHEEFADDPYLAQLYNQQLIRLTRSSIAQRRYNRRRSELRERSLVRNE